jgi:DnaJ-class molecular chaperone
VKEMPGVVREGTNLFSNIAIDYTDAILGTVAQVILLSSRLL